MRAQLGELALQLVRPRAQRVGLGCAVAKRVELRGERHPLGGHHGELVAHGGEVAHLLAQGVSLLARAVALGLALVELAPERLGLLGRLADVMQPAAQLLGLGRLGLQLGAQLVELADQRGGLLLGRGARGRHGLRRLGRLLGGRALGGGDLLLARLLQPLQRALGGGGTAIGLARARLERRGALFVVARARARLDRALLERLQALAGLRGDRLEPLGPARLLA